MWEDCGAAEEDREAAASDDPEDAAADEGVAP